MAGRVAAGAEDDSVTGPAARAGALRDAEPAAEPCVAITTGRWRRAASAAIWAALRPLPPEMIRTVAAHDTPGEQRQRQGAEADLSEPADHVVSSAVAQ